MGKEVKIGLSVIGVLLCVFGGVLYVRLSGNKAIPDVAKKPAAKAAADAQGGNAETNEQQSPNQEQTDAPRLGGGPVLRRNKGDGSAFARVADEPAADSLPTTWTERQSTERQAPNESLGASAPDNLVAGDEQSPATDRYGRRYPDAEAVAGQNSRYPNEPFNMAAAEDQIANNDAANETGNQLADEPPQENELNLGGDSIMAEPGQPGDGYRIADDNVPNGGSELGELAETDPFPAAAEIRSPGPNRGGGLQTAREEVPLTRLPTDNDDALSEGTATPPAFADRSGEPQTAANFAPISSRQPTPSTRDDEDPSAMAAASGTEAAYGVGDGANGANGVYMVEANDSFAAISKKVYGTDAYFQALHEHNRERYPNPDLLDVGDEIEVPDVAVLQQNYPQLCPRPRNSPLQQRGSAMLLTSQPASARGGQVYLVAEGDTLFEIAKRQLGKAARWKEIYELNQDRLGDDFNYLAPGMELLLPGDRVKPDPVAERPYGGRVRR